MSRPFSSASPLSLLCAACAIAFVTSCTPDRDLTPTGSSGTGGSGAGGTGGAPTTTSQGGETTTTTVPEPSGPTRLTVLNGINDYPAVRVCFMPYPGNGASVQPWPSSAAGLAFSKSVLVSPPSSIAPGGVDVQPHVIAGDLSAIAGMSCAEALALAEPSGGAGGGGAGGSGAGGGGGTGGAGAGGAGGAPPVDPPPVVVSPMPVIPASVFTADKSLLLVFFGCMGGPGHADGTEGLGCGFSYTLANPTANLTLVAMSRILDPGAVALQIVHASAAMQTSDVRIAAGFEGAPDITVAKSLALGGLGPKPPFTNFSRDDFGALAKVALKTFAPNDVSPTSGLLLQEAFTNGGIPESAFINGSSFTVVAVGGYPGVNLSSFWHPFTYVMVPSDPE